MDFLGTLFSIHSALRWVVLATGVVALLIGVAGWFGSSVSDKLSRNGMLAYVVALDVQVFLGIVLYVLGRWWAMPDRQIQLEHPITMLLALIVAHGAAARAKRALNPISAARGRAIGTAVSLVLVLAGIPWVRRGTPSPTSSVSDLLEVV